MKNQTEKQDAILTRKKSFEFGSGNVEFGNSEKWEFGNAEVGMWNGGKGTASGP